MTALSRMNALSKMNTARGTNTKRRINIIKIINTIKIINIMRKVHRTRHKLILIRIVIRLVSKQLKINIFRLESDYHRT